MEGLELDIFQNEYNQTRYNFILSECVIYSLYWDNEIYHTESIRNNVTNFLEKVLTTNENETIYTQIINGETALKKIDNKLEIIVRSMSASSIFICNNEIIIKKILENMLININIFKIEHNY